MKNDHSAGSGTHSNAHGSNISSSAVTLDDQRRLLVAAARQLGVTFKASTHRRVEKEIMLSEPLSEVAKGWSKGYLTCQRLRKAVTTF